MAEVHTGGLYGIRRPRTAVRVEITEWSRPESRRLGVMSPMILNAEAGVETGFGVEDQ